MAWGVCIAFSRAAAAAVAALAADALQQPAGGHYEECGEGQATSLSAYHSVESLVGETLNSTRQSEDTHMLAV